MGKKAETVFKERVKKDLEKLPKTWFVKIQQTTIRGIPDYLLCINGTFVALELKIETGELSKLQDWNLQGIAHAGGMAIVVSPDHWYDVYDLLKELALTNGSEGEYSVQH